MVQLEITTVSGPNPSKTRTENFPRGTVSGTSFLIFAGTPDTAAIRADIVGTTAADRTIGLDPNCF